MARLYREALEADGAANHASTSPLSRRENDLPFLQLPAPPVPPPQVADLPDDIEAVPLTDRLRRGGKPGRRR